MSSLRDFIDSVKPNFEEGGKFSKFRSTFGAFETFLFTPNTVNKGGVHVRDAVDLKRTITCVILALIPSLLFGIYNTGYQHFRMLGQLDTATFGDIVLEGIIAVFPILVVSYVVGLSIEFAVAQMRGHEVNEGFLATGMIIPLVMPADVPLWIVAVATAFAVIFGKEVFGGTGMNIWNPALVARAFLFFAYPTKMSGDSVWYYGYNEAKEAGQIADGFSGATALADHSNTAIFNFQNEFIGLIPGSIGETSALCCLIGAVILLWTGVASWKTMFSVVAGGALMGYVFNVTGMTDLCWCEQLVIGGFAFGAVFMATDPVTSCRTEGGKYIYGFLIGAMAVIIRVLNPGYPEGMMLAILLMNTLAPTIDYCFVQANISRRKNRVKKNNN